VFLHATVSVESLEAGALAQYRNFVGTSWETREADWRAGFRELYRRPPDDTR
jgi:hypothetical protein